MNMPQFNVSYMPQKINPAVSTSTVRRMLQQRITDAYNDPYFVSNVMQPLLIEQLLDQQVVNLSLGECQRVELCLCLGKVPSYYYFRRISCEFSTFYFNLTSIFIQPADIYLIDEPTAYLDPQLRMAAVKAIKGFIHHANKTAFLVEPDLEKPEHFADRVILFQGTPTLHCSADIPQYFFWVSFFFLFMNDCLNFFKIIL
jgi:ATP-binding cassette subfamily E protein 1